MLDYFVSFVIGLDLFCSFFFSPLQCNFSFVLLDHQGHQIRRLTRMSFVSGIVSGSISVTYMYASVSEFGVHSDVPFVEPWSWWTLQSFMRLEEVVVCFLVLITVSKSSSYDIFVGKFTCCCERNNLESQDEDQLNDGQSTSTSGLKVKVYSLIPFLKRQSLTTTQV